MPKLQTNLAHDPRESLGREADVLAKCCGELSDTIKPQRGYLATLASACVVFISFAGHIMTGKALARYAESKSWRFVRRGARASHMIYAHTNRSDNVSIPDHGSKDIARGTVESILKQIDGTWRRRQ